MNQEMMQYIKDVNTAQRAEMDRITYRTPSGHKVTEVCLSGQSTDEGSVGSMKAVIELALAAIRDSLDRNEIRPAASAYMIGLRPDGCVTLLYRYLVKLSPDEAALQTALDALPEAAFADFDAMLSHMKTAFGDDTKAFLRFRQALQDSGVTRDNWNTVGRHTLLGEEPIKPPNGIIDFLEHG